MSNEVNTPLAESNAAPTRVPSGDFLGDLRTRKGRRAEIINQIKEHGGWSIFWITEHRLRAIVATDMVSSKEITVRNRQFPWSDVFILPNDEVQGHGENVDHYQSTQ